MSARLRGVPVLSLCIALLACASHPYIAAAASAIAPPPGIREKTPRVQAFVHARIVVAPGRTIGEP